MDPTLQGQLEAELRRLSSQGLRRSLVDSAGAGSRIDFTSNDYLGLAQHPDIVEASARAVRDYGAGARASRLLGGGSPLDARVETAVAAWLGAEAALLFPTGYQTNLGLITALARRGDVVFSDARIHASLVDACRLSRAHVHVFAHNDTKRLEAALQQSRGARRRLVLTEGVFSMDGDLAPLSEMHELCLRYDAWLLIDEAHALGVIGPSGAGAWAAAQLDGQSSERVLARTITGGKALGAAGGLVIATKLVCETLLQSARSFIFTTGTPPAISGALAAAIEVASRANEERAKLRELARDLALQLEVPPPAAAIFPIVLGDNETALQASSALRERGFEVRAVRPPTVPQGRAQLRIVLHSFNVRADVLRLGSQLADVHRRAPIIEVQAKRKRPLMVVGTDTGIGKTVVAAAAMRALSRFARATYWKPVQTGDDSDTSTVRALTQDLDVRYLEPQHEFPLPASPHEAAAHAGARVQYAELQRRLDVELQALDVAGELVVELAGGLMVPYDDEHTQADWIAALDARILLVARAGLGTLNHTLLTLEALRARKADVVALVLVGEPHPSNFTTLRRKSGVPQVFELPLLDSVDPKALDAWIDANSGFAR